MVKKDKLTLICSECNSRNYTTNRTKNLNKRLELKKYCPKCAKTTLHKETK
ncbi:50S ribosomal protein L33 [Bulleidia sp. zg-1006]|uniref:50S ribosomal protein L33 n=1 Tax=Bacillati TaxID=1783272 RepID=UPI001939A514|nr:50S ribosomal protein L33 [Bulleidia sp. zg-1006]MBW9212447.1 50S ribosomal protein L33 [Trueperella sp. zg.1013]QRG86796.1 50S ribosomal protein L33 [Bulleidia sp. zg-1006]